MEKYTKDIIFALPLADVKIAKAQLQGNLEYFNDQLKQAERHSLAYSEFSKKRFYIKELIRYADQRIIYLKEQEKTNTKEVSRESKLEKQEFKTILQMAYHAIFYEISQEWLDDATFEEIRYRTRQRLHQLRKQDPQ
jgi:hypothetical protein